MISSNKVKVEITIVSSRSSESLSHVKDFPCINSNSAHTIYPRLEHLRLELLVEFLKLKQLPNWRAVLII